MLRIILFIIILYGIIKAVVFICPVLASFNIFKWIEKGLLWVIPFLVAIFFNNVFVESKKNKSNKAYLSLHQKNISNEIEKMINLPYDSNEIFTLNNFDKEKYLNRLEGVEDESLVPIDSNGTMINYKYKMIELYDNIFPTVLDLNYKNEILSEQLIEKIDNFKKLGLLKDRLDRTFTLTQKIDAELINKLFSVEQYVKENNIDGAEYVELQIPINLKANRESIALSLERLILLCENLEADVKSIKVDFWRM